jgi:hypothetical protein
MNNQLRIIIIQSPIIVALSCIIDAGNYLGLIRSVNLIKYMMKELYFDNKKKNGGEFQYYVDCVNCIEGKC